MDTASFSAKSCQACTTKTPKLSDAEVAHYLTLFPDWQCTDGKLKRQVKVKDFAEALMLANRIGTISEQENHHPDLLVKLGVIGNNYFYSLSEGID